MKTASDLKYFVESQGKAPFFFTRKSIDRCRVSAKDGSFTIRVLRSVAEGKFWNNENPTFYAC